MGYQASKAPDAQVVRTYVVIFLAVALFLTKSSVSVATTTVTSSNAISVSAVVVDPTAVILPPPPAGGGGGGGSGGGGDIPIKQVGAVLTMSGRFAPNTTLTILFSGIAVKKITTETSGLFATSIDGLNQGVYVVSLVGRDATRIDYDTSTSFTVYVNSGVETLVSNIKLPPLYLNDRDSFKLGESITYGVKAVPNSMVDVFLDNALATSVVLDASGEYSGSFKSNLVLGKHEIKLRERLQSSTFPFGKIYEFSIVSKVLLDKKKVTCGRKGDFNGDCKVNIIDFSILAFWHNRPNFPKKYDLNHDGKINVRDFSILAFYWTG